MDVQPTNTQQPLNWVNGLTLPGLIMAGIAASRWYSRKEAEAKTVVAEVLQKFEILRTNDLHHIQASLDRIDEHHEDVVDAIRASQDAIVAALLATRSQGHD